MSEQFSLNFEVRTRADLIRELKAAKEHGLSREFLRRCGISSLTACATELRRAGYEIEVTEGGTKMVFKAAPIVGARERAKAQLSMLEPPKPRGAYDD